MNLKIFFKFIPKSLTLSTVVFMIVSGFDGVIISQVISRITQFNKDSNLRSVFVFIFIAMLAYIVVTLSSTLSTICQNKVIKLWNEKVKGEYVYKQLYSNEKSLDSTTAISTLTNDFKILENKYFAVVFQVLYYAFMGIISIGYLIYLNFYLSLVFIIFAFLPMLSAFIFGNTLSKKTNDYTLASESFVSRVKDIFKGRSSIKVYDAEDEFMESAKKSINNMEEKSYKLNNFRALSDLCSALLSWISYIAPITVALVFVVRGYTDSAVVIAMFLACDRVIYPFRYVAVYMNQIKSTTDLRKNIIEKLTLKDEEKISNVEVKKAKIELENVNFGYANKNILESVNLKLQYGDKVLISGPSGSGKTTILDLIEGVSFPKEGRVVYTNEVLKFITNKKEKNINVARIRQDVYLYNDTLEFNLTFGKDFAKNEILAVLNEVGLIEELGENCLEKNYGEDGKELSGGQKQRIEIARALLFKKDILLVDEATAALDEKSSKKIREVIWNLPCTVVEVAHHFDENTIKENKIKHYELKNKKLSLV